MSPATHYRSF